MSRTPIPIAVLLLVSITHFAGIIASFDSRWSIPTARSILKEGTGAGSAASPWRGPATAGGLLRE
jgi:hypothetical protein